MLRIVIICLVLTLTVNAQAQPVATDLYDLVRSFMYDSTGYENVGSWAVNQPKKYKVKWKTPGIEMSDDTAINMYRRGTAEISIAGRQVGANKQSAKWEVMLLGSRMGYSTFHLSSPALPVTPAGWTVDSLFGSKPFRVKLLSSCDKTSTSGFYFYELKIPKKDPLYLKISWESANTSVTLRIEGYDAWSRPKASIICP